MVGAGNAFPSVIAIIPLGENVNSCDVLKRILDSCQGNTIRYSMLGQVGLVCNSILNFMARMALLSL